MGQARLVRLTLKGFRSFVEETVIEMPKSGLVLIRGKNWDSGGSSGAGKSTVNLAIAYALGYCPLPSTDLRSFNNEDPPTVTLELETQEGLVVVHRGLKPFLSLNGQKTTSVKGMEDKLFQILGVQDEMLAALTFRQQQTPGRFLSKSDSEKKEFLGELLGLQKIEAAMDSSNESISKIRDTITFNSGIKRTLEQQIAPMQEQLTRLSVGHEFSVKELEEQFIQAKAKFNSSRTAATQLEHKQAALAATIQNDRKAVAAKYVEEFRLLQAEMTNLKPNQVVLVFEKQQELAAARQRCLLLQNEVSAMLRLPTDSEVHDGPISKNEQAIETFKTSICSTCEQTLPEETQANVIAKFEAELARLRSLKAQAQINRKNLAAKQNELKLAEADKNALEREESGFLAEARMSKEKVQAEFQSEKYRLESRISDLKARSIQEADAATEQNRKEKESIEKEIQVSIALQYKHKGDLDRLEMELNHRKLNDKKDQAERDRLKGLIDANIKKLKTTEKALQEANTQSAAELDFSALCKDFLAVIFDEILDEISAETNTILECLPNAQSVTLKFESESLTARGTVKKSIKPIISINGNVTGINSCSGGMYTSLALAVDLAVANVIARRSNCNPCWLMLDEAFDGQDLITKEACLAMLAQQATNKLILVVDHSSETKEFFSNFIDVEFKFGISTVKGTNET